MMLLEDTHTLTQFDHQHGVSFSRAISSIKVLRLGLQVAQQPIDSVKFCLSTAEECNTRLEPESKVAGRGRGERAAGGYAN